MATPGLARFQKLQRLETRLAISREVKSIPGEMRVYEESHAHCSHVDPRRILCVIGMHIAEEGKTIETLEEWFLHAPPEKGEKQWVVGRSAKEMARAWLGGESRKRLLDLLRPVFGSVTLESAEPECNVPFDEFSGPRQCDLAIQASNDRGRIVVHYRG